MLSSRLFWKILGAHLVLILATAVILMPLMAGQHRAAATARIQEQLTSLVAVVALAVPDETIHGPPVALDELLRQWRNDAGVRLDVVSESGVLLASSDDTYTASGNLRDRAEIAEARRHGSGTAVRRSRRNDVPELFAAVRVSPPIGPVRFVRAARSLAVVDSGVRQVERSLLVAVGLTSLAAILSSLLITTSILKPAREVEDALELMAEGRWDQDLRIEGQSEITALAGKVNALSDHLGKFARARNLENQGLQEDRERLSTVLRGMIEGVIAVDPQQRIVFANPAAQELLEGLRATDVGRPLWERVRNPTILRLVSDALEGVDQQPAEFRIPRTGSVVAMLATRLPGTPCPGVVVVLHDVTELRRLENLRYEFVGNVSHELKTPLAAIQAYTETLIEGAIDEPQFNREFLGRIQEQAERLHVLIQNLLKLARIESGQEVFQVSSLDAREVIEASVEAHQAVAQSRNIRLEYPADDQELRVQADAERLRTILDNLLDNAIKYTAEGGRVGVESERQAQAVFIRVSDTGIGIDAEHLPRVFERFYRTDTARSRDAGGNGLGLSIVKHLAEVFGGSVEVASQPGQGSVFTLRLPVS